MIFVTVGTQLGFDRLIQYVDEWLGGRNSIKAYAQIASGKYIPTNMPYVRYLNSQEYFEKVAEAELIVGHAGMGTVITAWEHKKPLIVVARSYAHGEHRSNHQIESLNKMRDIGWIKSAKSCKELAYFLNRYTNGEISNLLGQSNESHEDDMEIKRAVKNYIDYLLAKD